MLEILYEDNHLIAVNKKSGQIVQGDKTGDTPLSDCVKTYIKREYNKKGNVFLGTIHRLDRPTCGIVLYARTSKALKRMNEQFRERKIQKTYWAIVNNPPPNNTGCLTNYLKKNQQKNKSYVSKKRTGKYASLNYKIINKLKNFYLLEIKPQTGRHHQIRVQLSNIGCNIKGDIKYGAKRSNKDASINLLAQKLEFIHPVKKEPITIIAPPPNNSIWQASKLGQHLL